MKRVGERNGKSERQAQSVNTRRTVTSGRLICRTDNLWSVLFRFLSLLLPRLLDPSLISRHHSH